MNERVIWIVNAYAAWKNIETTLVQSKRLIIKWKYPKRWVIDICGWKDTTVYLDVSPKGKNLLQIWCYQGVLYGEYSRAVKPQFREIGNRLTGTMETA